MTTTSAPPLDCAVCGRRIGKTKAHILLGDPPEVSADRLLCIRCMQTRRLHARFYPDCPEDWHDLYDHPGSTATRAAAANLLGLWP